MTSSKLDFLHKYNELVNSSTKASSSLPNELCDFLVSEYDIKSAILFKVNENNILSILGRSTGVNQVIRTDNFYCEDCKLLLSPLGSSVFNVQANCKIQISDHIQNEGCLALNVTNNDRVLFKVAKDTPFTPTEILNWETLGKELIELLKIYFGYKASTQFLLGDIVVNIAHELRTPTNSIMGFASLLNEDNLTSSQAEYVSTLKENAFSLLALINDLIDLAKIEKGLVKENQTNISIKGLIDDVVKVYSEKVKDKIEFLVNIDNVPDTIKYDAQKLRFILINILGFSILTTENGKITIFVTGSKNKLNVRISDTSSGISQNKLKNIFLPFGTVELGKNKVGNVTGLGLTLSKKYIELLRGNIEVLSSIGKGNTFNFHINAENASASLETQLSKLPPPGKKNKVLVVEDDFATSKLLSNYLSKWGYDPVIVDSAMNAKKAIENEHYLAVLMDIVLPDANGFELLKDFREHKNTRNTPVIVCSVEAEQQKAFLMGAVEYFVKPIKYKYLVEVLTSYKLKSDSNILIVDDDLPTLNLMKQAVEQAGYNAVAENKSSNVMNLIQNLQLDLAIVDLDMPEVNGFELIKLIKSRQEFARLPIIIYTGKENYKDDLAKIDGLFTDLLHKSSKNIEDLADTINQMINRFDEPSKPQEIAVETDLPKILLVEDYKHSQIIVTRLLKKSNYNNVIVVENGAEALEEVQKQKFDLILMDMQMPVMNGFEATERIRQLEEYKEIPIIALTAFAMKGDREKCLEAGATDYIPKPIEGAEFIEKVKYYTGKKISV